ncbi:etoposide-induced protein 2.4-domain-containing protein [Amylocystis lapponica]|nr:etoposide-induced protein 2.4-domain-containing protein [Amylocystis lapponica]
MSRPLHRAHPPPLTGYSASRASYPSFLSLQDTARIQLRCASKGLIDAFRWDTVVRLVATDAEVRANVCKSLLLNSLSLASISFFDFLILPLAQGQQRWLQRHVGWAYQILWLLPVVGASLYLNNSWCTLLAKRTFTLQHGNRAGAAPPTTYTGMLNALATSAYGAMMVFTSLITSFILARVPLVGPAVAFAFFCWVDAYYSFEFVWIARGLSLARRVRHLEERWAYYFAFGLPSAALCMWGSSLANAALFALFFPAYIIMAMHARPLPLDPYNPSPSAPSANDDIRHPSPLVPIRLPIFVLVLWLNDWVVRILSVGGGRRGARGPARHRRVLSDVAESVEEGEVLAHEMGPTNGGVAGRMRMGVNRRKLD